jgi:osmoprotectant transport system ATP-binding protein
MPEKPHIEIKTLQLSFNDHLVLNDLSFDVNKGECLAILGTSGSGKSTLLKTINGLVKAQSGSILINGQSIKSLDLLKFRRKTGYVVQQNALFPHLSIKENLWMIPNLENLDKSNTQGFLEEIMSMLGLDFELLGKMPAALSGGQLQRFNVVRALIHQPELLLMDEPFSALDPITKQKAINEFLQVLNKLKITTLLVTHSAEEAFQLADRILLLHQGIIQQIARPEDLLHQPANKFVLDFFANSALQLEWELIKKSKPDQEFDTVAKVDYLKERLSKN